MSFKVLYSFGSFAISFIWVWQTIATIVWVALFQTLWHRVERTLTVPSLPCFDHRCLRYLQTANGYLDLFPWEWENWKSLIFMGLPWRVLDLFSTGRCIGRVHRLSTILLSVWWPLLSFVTEVLCWLGHGQGLQQLRDLWAAESLFIVSPCHTLIYFAVLTSRSNFP